MSTSPRRSDRAAATAEHIHRTLQRLEQRVEDEILEFLRPGGLTATPSRWMQLCCYARDKYPDSLCQLDVTIISLA